jgi:hypothetical protein
MCTGWRLNHTPPAEGRPKTEHKSWQTRNAARKEKQVAYPAKLAAAE